MFGQSRDAESLGGVMASIDDRDIVLLCLNRGVMWPFTYDDGIDTHSYGLSQRVARCTCATTHRPSLGASMSLHSRQSNAPSICTREPFCYFGKSHCFYIALSAQSDEESIVFGKVPVGLRPNSLASSTLFP